MNGKDGRLVYTTDKNSAEFQNNQCGDLVSKGEVISSMHEDIDHLNKSIRRTIMEKITMSGQKNPEQTKSIFRKIIDLLFSKSDKKVTKSEIEKLMFGPGTADSRQVKFVENRLQDLRCASHFGDNFSEQKFFIEAYDGYWRINPVYDLTKSNAKQELIDYCVTRLGNRSKIAQFNREYKKKHGIPSRKYTFKKRVPKNPISSESRSVSPTIDKEHPIILDGKKIDIQMLSSFYGLGLKIEKNTKVKGIIELKSDSILIDLRT